ncbi:uncharacterized protein LOC101895400 [Musca domestica]|uniref:Uncharacterized protein LOC101895400 n=1 Tax=Musca domestica TaxID=7370 RepID=A0A1I8NF36_MUSDO|nr:uncharacterized protein LOC101895400 [Musca domestica]
MVADEMSGDSSNTVKERPVFIPPRKRQTNKKSNGTQNYVDHIANVQNRQKLSPSNNGLEEDLLNTKLLIKNKQPLPQIPVKNAGDSSSEIKSAAQSVDNIYVDDNELNNFESVSQGTKSTNRHESSTVTPSSYSESSLDVKLSKSHDCLSNRSSSKKRVNIRTDLPQLRSERNSPDQAANYEDLESGETSVLNTYDHSLERYQTARKSMDSTNYLTMTGTIKRGRKKGQSFDLQLNISRDELEKINAVAISTVQQKRENLCCKCSLNTGLHILVLSLICLPFVSLITAIYSFYIGTITWYNVFNYLHEEKSIIVRLLMSPILVAAYPVYILGCSIGLALYAGFAQLSFQFSSWFNEIADIEKGFYGWLCSLLNLSDCSPYEVVILTDIRDEPVLGVPPRLEIQTSNEELTL